MKAGERLLSYKLPTKGNRNTEIAVYLNPYSEDLRCLNCNKPIEEGMPMVVESTEVPPRKFRFNRHLSCFSTWEETAGPSNVGHTKFRDFLSKNPDLLILERLRGVVP